MKGDNLKGGLTDNWSIEDVAKKHNTTVSEIEKELESGINIEIEHTKDKKLAKEISLDHLYEIPDYYTRLENLESDAKKEIKNKDMNNEKKENITEFARRMRELAGYAEGDVKKSLKTVNEGVSTPIVNDENKTDDEFETHKFEQNSIKESETDGELYNLNENTIIVLDFIDEDED